MAKYIYILRPDNTVTAVRSEIETGSENPLSDHELIIKELYDRIKDSKNCNFIPCDGCGNFPDIIVSTPKGRFCRDCLPSNYKIG